MRERWCQRFCTEQPWGNAQRPCTLLRNGEGALHLRSCPRNASPWGAGACMAGAVSHRHAARRAASPLEETKARSVPCVHCSVASVPPLKQPQQVSDSGGNCWELLLQCLSFICQIKILCAVTVPHLCRVLGFLSPQKLMASKVPYITASPWRLQSAPLIRDLLKS